MKRLGSDLSSAQKEMKTKHKAYENAVGILSRRLQEALAAKESAEAELSQMRAQVADGGSDLPLHVGNLSAPGQAASCADSVLGTRCVTNVHSGDLRQNWRVGSVSVKYCVLVT